MTLKDLYLEYKECTKCPLHEERSNVVFGSGSARSKIMIVGESPSEEDDLAGAPFTGESGKLLNRLLKKVGLSRADLFLTYATCCRATRPKAEGKDGPTKIDRPPARDEITACNDRLKKTILLVDPILIVAMGNAALRALDRKKGGITAIRGEIYTLKLEGIRNTIQYGVLPIIHPSYLLRNPDTTEGSWVSCTLKDLKRVTKVHKEVEKWI